MKYLILLLLSVGFSVAQSQPNSRAWSQKFYNWIEVMVPASDGGWYVGGQSGTISFFNGYLSKLDAQGNQQWTYIIPAEASLINDIIELNKNLIVFTARSGLCDVLNSPTEFGAVDGKGKKLWLTSYADDPNIPFCSGGANLFFMPINNDFLIWGGQTYSMATADSIGMQVSYNCKVNYNNEVISASYKKLKDFGFIGLSHESNDVYTGSVNCNLYQKFSLGPGEGSIAIDTSYNVYCIRDTVIYKLNILFKPVDTILVPPSYSAKIGFVQGNHPKFLLQSNSNKEKFALFHLPLFDSPYIENIPNNYWIQDIVNLPNDSVLYYGSILLNELKIAPTYLYQNTKNSNSFFMHKSHVNNHFSEDLMYDLDFQSITTPSPEYYSSNPCIFIGGGNNYKFNNVQCKFKNTGLIPISEFKIKLRYNNCSFICSSEQILTYKVENINLLPGESMDYLLPPFTIVDQDDGPGEKFELCAWIVEPNQQPQSIISNDYACAKVDIISAVNEPGSDQVQMNIQPNPIHEWMHVKFEGISSVQGQINLINLLGEVMYSETTTLGVEEYDISMHNYPGGMYIIQYVSDGRIQATQKVVKQ